MEHGASIGHGWHGQGMAWAGLCGSTMYGISCSEMEHKSERHNHCSVCRLDDLQRRSFDQRAQFHTRYFVLTWKGTGR